MTVKCTHCGMYQPEDWHGNWCRYCTYPKYGLVEVQPRQKKKEPFRY